MKLRRQSSNSRVSGASHHDDDDERTTPLLAKQSSSRHKRSDLPPKKSRKGSGHSSNKVVCALQALQCSSRAEDEKDLYHKVPKDQFTPMSLNNNNQAFPTEDSVTPAVSEDDQSTHNPHEVQDFLWSSSSPSPSSTTARVAPQTATSTNQQTSSPEFDPNVTFDFAGHNNFHQNTTQFTSRKGDDDDNNNNDANQSALITLPPPSSSANDGPSIATHSTTQSTTRKNTFDAKLPQNQHPHQHQRRDDGLVIEESIDEIPIESDDEEGDGKNNANDKGGLPNESFNVSKPDGSSDDPKSPISIDEEAKIDALWDTYFATPTVIQQTPQEVEQFLATGQTSPHLVSKQEVNDDDIVDEMEEIDISGATPAVVDARSTTYDEEVLNLRPTREGDKPRLSIGQTEVKGVSPQHPHYLSSSTLPQRQKKTIMYSPLAKAQPYINSIESVDSESTFSFVSSFTEAQKEPQAKSPMSSHLRQKSEKPPQLTPHPFFWRSHPNVTVTSYDRQPGRPRRRVTPGLDPVIDGPVCQQPRVRSSTGSAGSGIFGNACNLTPRTDDSRSLWFQSKPKSSSTKAYPWAPNGHSSSSNSQKIFNKMSLPSISNVFARNTRNSGVSSSTTAFV